MIRNKWIWWTSVLLKMIVSIGAISGVAMSASAGKGVFMGGNKVFMFFTIQSNIAMAMICVAGLVYMLLKKKPHLAGQLIKLMGTVSITLTGMVFCFVLAPVMRNGAWSVPNVLTHVVVPVASVADFLLIGSVYDYRRRDVLWVIVPPLLYVIYAAIGYVSGWNFGGGSNYPYFFLNWGSEAGAFGFCKGVPWMGCGWWILLLLLFLIGVSLLYLRILNLIRRRFRPNMNANNGVLL